MPLFHLAIALLSAISPVAAAQVSISQVSSVVSSATSSFAPAVIYAGPTGSASSALASSSTAKVTPQVVAATPAAAAPSPYWLESITHQGISAFNSNPASYQVFRNVKSFGAKGDGSTDDTAAIQAAMSAGGRCAPGSCLSSTTTPAIVYFPAGTYIISSSIIDYYYTQIIGNPNNMPVLKATPNFSGFGIIDGDQYGANGLKFGATNVFFRQIRNLVFDLTAIPSSSSATGLHWPTAQATSLQNCVFKMSDAPGTQHQGLFIENGSGGFMNDLVFYGGLNGVVFGNQQFTVRNLTFYNAVTAIDQIWDWGWTYTGISINNCTTGLNMAGGGTTGQSTGSVTFLDSSFTNTKVAIITAHNASSFPATAGSLILDNIVLTNTPVVVQGPQGTVLKGGSLTISGWGEGHEYTANYQKKNFQSSITKFSRPSSLTKNGQYYARSKPQYQASPLSQFVSVRTAGAKGDGLTDDTAAINSVLKSAAAASKIVFFDAGTYKVTSTITIPGGSKVVGESFSVIMGAGSFFSSITSPQPVVAVGAAGQSGVVEWSDMIVSTQGATAGAILIQWNLASTSSSPSGMWDVHTRIGGFAGSNLQLAQCPTTPNSAAVNQNCVAAFMSMYIAPSATGLYMENNWLWTADHDLEDPSVTQITVYTGRGLYCASTSGTIWLVGTAVEHHALYQYQFVKTKNVFAGQIQTETAYWQPNPNASVVFPIASGWNDPDFATSCAGVVGQCNMGWGLRVVNSSSILVYGAGLYSFFNNYSVACSNSVVSPGNGGACQTRIFSVEGTATNVDVYNLNTVGATQMVTRDGKQVALFSDNANVYPDTIAYYKSS